jgi:glucosamine--fructose-6-phosphate aminotransferase (isomerizing)
VKGETFIASDIPALLDYTRKVAFLEDGEVAEVSADSFRLFNDKGNRFRDLSRNHLGRGGGGRAAIAISCSKRFTISRGPWRTRFAAHLFERRQCHSKIFALRRARARQIERIHLVAWDGMACVPGGQTFMIEEIAQIPAEVDYGSGLDTVRR